VRVLAGAWWGLFGVGLLAAACGRSDTTVVTPPSEAPRAPAPASSAAASPAAASPAAASPAAASPAAASPTSGATAAAGSGPATATAPGAAAGAASLPAAVASPSSGAAAPPSGEAYRHALPGRLIAIGDLHGDAAATRAALRLGGAIDGSGRWIGGNLSVVQTGDVLDRGDDERAILDLLEQLTSAAQSAGGQLVALNGNHEVMNVQGDFRYVTPAGVAAFGGVRPRSPHARAAPPSFEDRAAAFLPGGAYALQLAQRDVVAVVGDSLFVHGGVLPEHVRYGVDRINHETREWMRAGDRRAPESVASDSAPIWVREYSLDPVAPSACEKLAEVLRALNVQRMVVGHTVQNAGISSACDGRVWRIDVGLSRYYGDRPIQVLEIQQGKLRVLSAPRDAK
jgi:hypothetical protein